MIPADQLNPAAVQGLAHYLRTEIMNALSQRKPLEQKWIKWLKMYRGIPEFEVKEFPFIGAANLVIPVAATDVDTVYSRIMGILFGPSNLWTARPLNDQMVDFSARLGEFLEWAQNHELNAYEAVADWVLEICQLGTGVLKQRYRRELKQVYEFRETPDGGAVEEHKSVLLHDHPQVDHVSLFDFLIPATAIDIDSAPWVAERLTLTWGQLQARARGGIYQGVERLASSRGVKGADSSPVLRSLQENDRFMPSYGDCYEIWEGWLDYDITGSGTPQAIVCTVHLPSLTFLRIDYNPFFNQEKPYSVARYLRQAKRFYGIGLCEMDEHFQEEVTTMHNQRLDNATLANSTLMKARKNIGIKENEPIFPGRWFLLDNMDDVQSLPLGQRYDSTVPYEQLTLSYSQRRTGVNDYISGDFSPAMGYSTATVGVQQLRESAKRFDQVMREIRVALAETGTRVVELYQQFNLNGKEFLAMGQKDGAMVQQVLRFPLDMIRASVGIDVTATSAAYNKEVEVRTNTIIMQMTTQFYQQGIQALGIVLNPQVPQPIRSMAWNMVNGQSILMRRLLDSYGIQDADRLMPELEEVMNGGQAGAGMGGQQGMGQLGGGPFGAPAPGPASGMGLVPQMGGGMPGLYGQAA